MGTARSSALSLDPAGALIGRGGVVSRDDARVFGRPPRQLSGATFSSARESRLRLRTTFATMSTFASIVDSARASRARFPSHASFRRVSTRAKRSIAPVRSRLLATGARAWRPLPARPSPVTARTSPRTSSDPSGGALSGVRPAPPAVPYFEGPEPREVLVNDAAPRRRPRRALARFHRPPHSGRPRARRAPRGARGWLARARALRQRARRPVARALRGGRATAGPIWFPPTATATPSRSSPARDGSTRNSPTTPSTGSFVAPRATS